MIALFDFNPQVPCGTRRFRGRNHKTQKRFQSTGPLRDPTQDQGDSHSNNQHFNPQVPCGTRRDGSVFLRHRKDFNPQVPCGTRLRCSRIHPLPYRFQSTGPLRDPTISHLLNSWLFLISIHRSLAGPDLLCNRCCARIANFNPQVPCGTRPDRDGSDQARDEFQSTGPLRDPTDWLGHEAVDPVISIHRSLAGPDWAST